MCKNRQKGLSAGTNQVCYEEGMSLLRAGDFLVFHKITHPQENFVCAADRLVRTLLVDRPPGPPRRARADVAVWVPGGAFTSKQCALLGAHEKSRSTWLRLPIKTLGEGPI